ncbi:putative FATTY ACID SYNTHASE FAS domain protein [Mycobacterium xenopi 3993]|nr:putative FATTY ACID SYNTHASE FAS domain protein [Mycobacterium xenopi 3993]
MIALVHPQAFLAALSPEQREDYQRRADARLLAGQRRLARRSPAAAHVRTARRPPLRPPGSGKAAGGGDATEPGRAAWRRRRLPPVNGVIG